MIVSKDINPERDVYYLGAKVLEIMNKSKSVEQDFFDVFQQLTLREKISVNLYTLTLDWLFLLGAIKKNSKGDLQKCF